MITCASARPSTARSAVAARGRSSAVRTPYRSGTKIIMCASTDSRLRSPGRRSPWAKWCWNQKSCSLGRQRCGHYLSRGVTKRSPISHALAATTPTFIEIALRALLVSPTNRRLDSQAQSCGLSLPTFTRERIGIMPAQRIGLPGSRNAFAGCYGPRLPIPGKRGGARVPNGLAAPGSPAAKVASARAANLAMAGGCEPLTDPSGARS